MYSRNAIISAAKIEKCFFTRTAAREQPKVASQPSPLACTSKLPSFAGGSLHFASQAASAKKNKISLKSIT